MRDVGDFEMAILGALQKLKHMYAGTVDYAVKEERRIKNRVAKRSRKINRRK